jgi:cytochrome P450
MALTSLLDPLNILGTLAAAIISYVIYTLYLHPLSHIPGPTFARWTSLYLYRLSYTGIEASAIDALHAKYGPVVRIAPNEVDIADGAALHTVYVKNGGFLKNPCYSNFDIDGFPTVFSDLEPTHRAVRSKAVVGMFAPQAIREGRDVIYGCVDRMVDRLQIEKEEAKGLPINVLGIFRSLALDAVTAYLFGQQYNGINEKKLSAGKFVDSFVAVGRFFYLPNWLFKCFEFHTSRQAERKIEVWRSFSAVDRFALTIVDEARVQGEKAGDTYQARLLKAGISREETIAQCKDLMFAGTDSTGMNLASICFHLAQHPDKYVCITVLCNAKLTHMSDTNASAMNFSRIQQQIHRHFPTSPRS